MPLEMLPPGMVAALVTYLEMTERPPPPSRPAMSPLKLARWSKAEPERYRALFRRVGEPWLWFSRLVMDDDALTAIIHHPDVHRSEEHTSELQSLMRISYAVFCLKK